MLDGIFRLEKGVNDQTVLTDFPLLFSESNLPHCRVIERDGRIVSHAALWPRWIDVEGRLLRVAIIVLVATASECRREGLAAALVRDLQRTMHLEHYELGILWTGVPAFYERLGWRVVRPPGWLAHSVPTPPLDASVVDYAAERHLEPLWDLHLGGTVHTRRTLNEMATLLELPKCHVTVALQGDRPAAYLVDARAVNKRGWIEYAGPAELVWALVTQSSADSHDRPLLVFPTHEPLAALATAAGWPVEPLASCKGFGEEMILIVNPEVDTPEILDRLFTWGLDQA